MARERNAAFGKRIKALRDSLGLSQKQAGARADMEARQWATYEKGKVPYSAVQKRIRGAYPEIPPNFFTDASEPIAQSVAELIEERLTRIEEIVAVLRKRDDARWEAMIMAIELMNRDEWPGP